MFKLVCNNEWQSSMIGDTHQRSMIGDTAIIQQASVIRVSEFFSFSVQNVFAFVLGICDKRKKIVISYLN